MGKIKDFFQNEKVKSFGKKVFNKKTFTAAVIIIVLAAALRIGFFCLFEVQGTVQKVDGTKITVANFLTTQTVDVGSYPISGVQVGDRIEITKNLSGQVLSVRDNNGMKMRGKGNRNFQGGQNFRGNGEHNFRGKR
ncbi:MAG: hypothetical protein Q8936_11010 [Bacillota bacterium]|nr:hypothetical protein [Bacillota bacterium]